jgi:SAM-dependent methyltransferase
VYSVPYKTELTDQELFDEIGHDYVKKDLTGYCRISRKQRLTRSLRYLPKPMGDILEVGCGAGFAATYLAGGFGKFLGLDYSQTLIDYANQYNALENTKFLCQDVKDLAEEQTFDVIFMIGVVHHIPEAQQVLEGLKSRLAPGGVIVANEPQRGNPVIGLMRKIRKRTDEQYSDDQVDYSDSEIKALFERCGYTVRLFPQGIFSTPLAETRILPAFLGYPLALLCKVLDPIFEALINVQVLRKIAWNIVVEARIDS